MAAVTCWLLIGSTSLAWLCMMRSSSLVSAPGLLRMALGTLILPTSCNMPQTPSCSNWVGRQPQLAPRGNGEDGHAQQVFLTV